MLHNQKPLECHDAMLFVWNTTLLLLKKILSERDELFHVISL